MVTAPPVAHNDVMHKARLIRLDGVTPPCILLAPHGEVPEQLVVDFAEIDDSADVPHRGPMTYRLEPSTAEERTPVYRELFEE